MSETAKRLALHNLRELQALDRRLEADHVAKQRIAERIQEAKEAVRAVNA